MDNRPRRREKKTSGTAATGAYRRGSGIGSSKPVGRKDGYSGRKQQYAAQQHSSSADLFRQDTQQDSGAQVTRGLGGGKLILIILAAVLLLGGGGGLSGLLGNLFGGGSGDSGLGSLAGLFVSPSQAESSSIGSLLGGGSLTSLFGSTGTTSSNWSKTPNTGKLDRSVASGSRDKYTNLLGNGKDNVTIMVYMCGTDLESQSGMASADLQEMLNATISSKVNLIVYTGGCSKWKNNRVSSSYNQIYKIDSDGLHCIVENSGTDSMTNPKTLRSFLSFCMDKYKANRYMLIFWDHGGGSLSGYGYDEKNKSTGSMTLAGINDALKGYERKFDFIGFDACLMGTLENGLMLAPYADYLIASEETEPGIGWYYTDWLTALSSNTSMSTLDIGKNIVDSFVQDCEKRCAGQKATLSVVDLAELSNTAPDSLSDFAVGTSKMLQSDGYQTVSDARSGTREFASSNKIDQIDLVDFAYRLNTKESLELADSLLGAVKYNRTASSISNAYGISIYFPYRKTSGVNTATSTYNAIGIDSDYTACIRQFASIESGGQAAASGSGMSSGSPLGSLPGGGSSSGGGLLGSADISSLLGSLMGGNVFGRELDTEATANYIAEHQFDASQLVWRDNDGVPQIKLSEDRWSLVHSLAMNVFLDDGEGYIDLGIDNVYELSDDGALCGIYDGTWLTIDGQLIAYYYTDTVENGDDYTISGYVPVMLNDQRAELILVFDSANPYGYVAGARFVYLDGSTETVAKGITELQDGDTIDFLCDYYTYDGEFIDSYYLGEQYTWHGQPEISNGTIDAPVQLTFVFTDIYNNEFWTPALKSE